MNKLNQLTEITQCTVCGNKIPMVYAFEAWCAECAQGFDGNEVTTISQFTADDLKSCWYAALKYFKGDSDKDFNDFMEERKSK